MQNYLKINNVPPFILVHFDSFSASHVVELETHMVERDRKIPELFWEIFM